VSVRWALVVIVLALSLEMPVRASGFRTPLESARVGTHAVYGVLRLTPEPRSACAYFLEVAAAAGVPAGCEERAPVPDRPRLSEPGVLSGRLLSDVLAELHRAFPSYESRWMNGVIVTRPVTSWRNPRHYLHRRFDAATFGDEGGVVEALQTVARLWTGSSRSWPEDPDLRARRLHVEFSGGSGVELLNEIVRSDGGLLWRMSQREVEHIPGAVYLELATFEGPGMGGSLPVTGAN
jgi:hypothetical protein